MSKPKTDKPKTDKPKTDKPNTDATPATATSDKPAKKPRKVRDPNLPPIVRAPWATRQLERVNKLLKGANKLAKRFGKATQFSAEATILGDVVTCLDAVAATLSDPNALTYKPVVRVGNKPAVGNTIKLKDDAHEEAIFKLGHAKVETYTGAVITYDDRVYWLVKCHDGEIRAIGKKLVTIA